MKNHPLPFLTFSIAAVLLAVAGCSDKSRKDSDPLVSSADASHTPPPPVMPVPLIPGTPVPTAPNPVAPVSPDPFADISAALDQVTRDTTANLTTPQGLMDRAIDAQIASWKASGATSTSMGEEELALARTDFTQKLRSLSLANDETWKSAKDEALMSLQNLRRVYAKFTAGHPDN